MQLWSIINQEQYDYIQKNGYLHSDGSKIWPDFKSPYKWLIGQMIKKIDPPPKNVTYPIWAWAQWEGESRKKPDIRTLRHSCGNGTFYRIELEIPKERIVLSNFIDWHHVLNSSYLAFSEIEDDKFDNRLMTKNLEYGNWDNYPNDIQNVITESWERIFDFISVRQYCYGGEIKDREIQATFWVLYNNDIKKIDKFESKETNI